MQSLVMWLVSPHKAHVVITFRLVAAVRVNTHARRREVKAVRTQVSDVRDTNSNDQDELSPRFQKQNTRTGKHTHTYCEDKGVLSCWNVGDACMAVADKIHVSSTTSNIEVWIRECVCVCVYVCLHILTY